MEPKFELKIYDVEGADFSFRGLLSDFTTERDFVQPWHERPWENPNPSYTPAEGRVFFRGTQRPWDWHDGQPTWAEEIPEEPIPVRVLRGVRQRGGRPSRQGSVCPEESPLWRLSSTVQGTVLHEGEPDWLP